MAGEPRLSHTSAMILQGVSAGHIYGYTVMEVTGLPSGTVYPALRRLERDQLIRSHWERQSIADAEQRPPRKYYKLTRAGETILETSRKRYPLLASLSPFAEEVQDMSNWLPNATLRVASLLAPSDQRAELVKDWQSELWYIPLRGAVRFSLGAFRDALWLRRNNLNPVTHKRFRLESPFACLAFLAALSAATVFIAIHLPLSRRMILPPANRASVIAGLGGILIFYLPLLAVPLLMGKFTTNRPPLPWRSKLRNWLFLALKIVLLLPIMQCGLVIFVQLGPIGSVFGLGFDAACILAFRWIFTDQQQRCPVCLRHLTEPVRIGTSSHTFLEWYGAESTCSRGHGLLHTQETSLPFSCNAQWLQLDDSWSTLFEEGVHAGHHDA